MTGASRIVLLMFSCSLFSCGRSETKPVELFPEDMCAYCRMGMSDPRFAAEIISDGSEVFKFDDIGCMDRYRVLTPGLTVAAAFVKDFETSAWIRFEKSIVIKTGVATPMGSGKVAFADSARATDFLRRHPRR